MIVNDEWYGPNPVMRVSYPKQTWSKSEAWDHLQAQMIPGCPRRPMGEIWTAGWVKDHTATYDSDEWSWVYLRFGR